MPCRCFINNPSDFTRLSRSRRCVRRRGWRLCADDSPHNTPRFAVVVAKRHVRTAVARNRIRRVLREFFRQELMASLPARLDFLLLVTAAPALPPRGEALRAECRQMFSQLLGNG